ncbi:peptidase [Shewanella youngdeokensis]|uniref:Peptidase n=1 Tax=Shewanella youngdeokensis TaxID=2999068 RepID=A0ABZ0JZ28_9GAMM|nr:peptidase [Shewanella sp. DAU334]
MTPASTIKRVLSASFLHRWLMLIFAIPIVIWTVSGSYFVLFDIGFIRSDHVTAKVQQINTNQLQHPIAKVYQAYPSARSISLVSQLNQAIYQVTLADKKLRIDGQSGEVLPLLTHEQARQIAQQYQHETAISPSAKLSSVTLIETTAPAELAARHLPVWRVEFDDISGSTLYVSAQSGDVVTYRHEYWRWFDLFWKWHIMDYDDGASIDNSLLFYSAAGSLVAVFSGFILVWQRRKRYVECAR